MHAARAALLALGVLGSLSLISIRSVNAQVSSDTPTGGTSARRASDFERPAAPSSGASIGRIFYDISRARWGLRIIRVGPNPVGQAHSQLASRRRVR